MDQEPDLDPLSLPADWLRSHASLRRLAVAVLGDEGLSEDAVQSAYLSALGAPGRKRNASWWRRAVRSRAIDRRRLRAAHEAPPGAEARERTAPSTDEIVARLELQRAVLRAVEELDDPYREVVYLRFFEQSTPTAIAERLGVPIKTVKTRLTRGLDRLRSKLGARYDERDWRGRLAAVALIGHDQVAVVAEASTSALTIGATGALLGMKKLLVAVAVLAVAALTWRYAPPLFDGPIDPRAPEGEARLDVAGVRDADELARPLTSGRSMRSEATPTPDETSGGPRQAVGPGRVIVRLHWYEGGAAAHVGVLLQQGGERRSHVRDILVEETDGDGVAVFETVRAGPFVVSSFRGSEDHLARDEVEAGGTTELDVSLGTGIRVTGVVQDENGAAVPAAQVWMTSNAPSIFGGRVVAVADSLGRFEVRDVPSSQSLGALARGHAPSELIDLDTTDRSVDPVEMTLVVVGGGASFRGIVVDAENEPVEGARVAVRSPHPEVREMNPNGTFAERWTPRSVVTGPDGRFSIDGLLPGRSDVDVLARGHPVWHESLELVRGEDRELTIELAAGASVRGTLVDGGGAPVAGGTVVAFAKPVDERFLQTGQLPGGGTFGRDRARTDEQGAFQLEPLSTGTTYLYAQPRKDPRRAMGTVIPWDSATLELVAGTETVWDARLDEGHVIEGRIGYSDGTPLAGVFVSVRDVESGREFATFTQDGSFRFIRLSNVAHDVRVQLQDPPPNTAPLEAKGVLPDGAPLELLADFGPPGSTEPATLTIRFDDRAGRAGGDPVMLSIESIDAATWQRGESDGDVWTFRQPHPGSVRIVAFAAEKLIAATDPITVDHGDTIDLGTLSTEPGGSLAVTIRRGEGTDLFEIHTIVKHDGSFRWQRFALGRASELRVEGLEPGRHDLRLLSQGAAQILRSVTIEPGRETALEVDLRRGAEVPYSIRWDFEDPPGRIEYSARSESGELILNRTWNNLADRREPIAHQVIAPVGVYTFVVSTDDGRRAEATFQVRALDDAEPASVELALRRP